ncbi:MAG: efflux RND transporter permease subunit [Spirochaetia bacterium]
MEGRKAISFVVYRSEEADIVRTVRAVKELIRKESGVGLIGLLLVVVMLSIFGTFLDSISLTALVLLIGIIVDNGIIISENIYHRREMGDSPMEAAVNRINEVLLPVLTTILTTFLASAPMFFMKGMMGKFVFVIPLTISLALFISLGVHQRASSR